MQGNSLVTNAKHASIADVILTCIERCITKQIFIPRLLTANIFEHVYREHNKDADTLATMGLGNRRQPAHVVLCRYPQPPPPNGWNSVRVFSDGGVRDGRSACGVVVCGYCS